MKSGPRPRKHHSLGLLGHLPIGVVLRDPVRLLHLRGDVNGRPRHLALAWRGLGAAGDGVGAWACHPARTHHAGVGVVVLGGITMNHQQSPLDEALPPVAPRFSASTCIEGSGRFVAGHSRSFQPWVSHDKRRPTTGSSPKNNAKHSARAWQGGQAPVTPCTR